MKNRPWPLLILALIQIFTPAFNIFFNAWMLDVSPTKVLSWALDRRFQTVFEFFALAPIAGFAILRMRRWSYGVFLGAMGWSLWAKIRTWDYASQMLPPWGLALIYLGEVLLVGYFLLPAVRTTYFDPRVRWWESKPRYELKLPSTIDRKEGERVEGRVLNVSQGGAFVQAPVKMVHGEEVEFEFWVMTQPFRIRSHIVHERELSPGIWCYGLQFNHDPASARRFDRMSRGLAMLGFHERDQKPSLAASFLAWARTVFTTGRGLTPEVPGSRPKKSA
jgi:hypothetical protein